MSRLYFSIFRIDLKKNFYEEISSDNSVHRLTGHRGMAQQKLNELCSTFVDPEYRLAVRQFFDLSTVPDRLAGYRYGGDGLFSHQRQLVHGPVYRKAAG